MEKLASFLPSVDDALMMLKEAEKFNPGAWVEHSMYVAKAAKLIAQNVERLDPEIAYILGLLHDIGRREGIHGMRHGIDGYNFAVQNGYDWVARICLTHIGFKHNNQPVVVGKWDGTQEEYNFVIDYLRSIEETDYDRLIKLCDYISLPSGFCLLEKRLVDMTMRGGINELTLPRWKSTFENKKYFEEKIGKSTKVLPNVMENTFVD